VYENTASSNVTTSSVPTGEQFLGQLAACAQRLGMRKGALSRAALPFDDQVITGLIIRALSAHTFIQIRFSISVQLTKYDFDSAKCPPFSPSKNT
jgi:hypothetical protein